MENKILICGVSGIGKTTLAKYIAARYRIPFISGSSSQLWDEFGYGSHLDIIKGAINDPEKGKIFQEELLDIRNQLISDNHGSLVSDRSVIDSIVYYLLQNSHLLSQVDNRAYLDKALDSIDWADNIVKSRNKKPGKLTIIYLDSNITDSKNPFPYQFTPDDDSKRITNSLYQNMVVNSVFETVLKYIIDKKPGLYVKRINVYNWEDRVSIVDRVLTKQFKNKSFIRQLWENL